MLKQRAATLAIALSALNTALYGLRLPKRLVLDIESFLQAYKALYHKTTRNEPRQMPDYILYSLSHNPHLAARLLTHYRTHSPSRRVLRARQESNISFTKTQSSLRLYAVAALYAIQLSRPCVRALITLRHAYPRIGARTYGWLQDGEHAENFVSTLSENEKNERTIRSL